MDTSALSASNLTPEQRKYGLLSAERLLTDLTKLDSYKIQTDKRRLQISKTISFAKTLPTELIELRQNGSVTFNTLMDWFDLDFPGHYLRLIKSVKVTMLALVPPVDGIHGMLRNTGESTVVVPVNGAFKPQRAARNFGEKIALDTAFNETGLFIFNYDDPMFLPFEGLGVETQWTLELPRATNRFNFDTLADVLITIEYTAEHDDLYAQIVRTKLDKAVEHGSDVAIPVASFFPDEWYDLMNPRPGASNAHDLTLTLGRGFFPPNLKHDKDGKVLQTDEVTLIITGRFEDLKDELCQKIAKCLKVSSGSLALDSAAALGSGNFVQSKIEDSYIYLSTRQSGPPADPPVHGASVQVNPVGDWKLEFDDAIFTTLADTGDEDADGNPVLKPLINWVADVLLVLTVEGTVDWPPP